MPRKGHSPEKILNKLQTVEVAVAKGTSVAQAVRDINFIENTCYRWRKEHGGLNIDQARRLKQLEQALKPPHPEAPEGSPRCPQLAQFGSRPLPAIALSKTGASSEISTLWPNALPSPRRSLLI